MSASVPNVEYIITEENKEFFYTISPSDYSVIIPIGNYDIDELLLALNTALTLQLGADAIVLALDKQTGKVRATTTNSLPFRMRDAKNGNSMASTLGILKDQVVPSFDNLFDGFPNLRGLTECFIVSSALSDFTGMIAKNIELGAINNIPITVGFGCTEKYQQISDYTDSICYPRARNISTIDVKLYDQDLKLMNLGGLPFEMVLKIWY